MMDMDARLAARTDTEALEARMATRAPEVEDLISYSLRYGGLIGTGIVLIGMVLMLATGRTGYPAGAVPISIQTVASGLTAARPLAIIDLGLLILLLTPFVQMAVAAGSFLAKRDYTYAGIALFVLLVLVVSLIVGRME